MSSNYKEVVASEYVEVNNLGMKTVISEMCDVLNIPEFIDQFVGIEVELNKHR